MARGTAGSGRPHEPRGFPCARLRGLACIADGRGGGAARSRSSATVGLALASPAVAHDRGGRDLGRYTQRDLVSDVPGAAELPDPSLVNAWGLAFGPTTRRGSPTTARTYRPCTPARSGPRRSAKVPLTVSIPGGAPTGAVFNGSTGFVVHSGTSSGPARFLFSSEAGTITGWSPAVPPPPTSTQAQTAVTVPGAIFKGLAIADTATGPQIYASDFHNGEVDVWDANFAPVKRAGAFTDPALPAGYAPFGIQADDRRDRRHLRQAGRRCRGRSGRARQGLRRRLRHERDPAAPLRLARSAQRAMGRRAGAAGLRRGQRSAADRQLRRRAHQRLRPVQRPASSARCAASTAGRSRSTGCGRWSSATA